MLVTVIAAAERQSAAGQSVLSPTVPFRRLKRPIINRAGPFAWANDPNARVMAAVTDLPLAYCPPMADGGLDERPYGKLETLPLQLGAAFIRSAESSR